MNEQKQKYLLFLDNLFENKASSQYVSGILDSGLNTSIINQIEYNELEDRRLNELNDL